MAENRNQKTDQQLLEDLAAALNALREAGMQLYARPESTLSWDVNLKGGWIGSVTPACNRGPWEVFHSHG